jgi:hypothetical protein
MDPDRARYLNTLKHCGREFSNLKKLQIKRAIYGNVSETLIAEKIGEINQSLNTIPTSSELWHRSVHNPNETFKNLLNRIRNRALSTQKHMIRIQDLAIAEIKKKMGKVKRETNNDLYEKLSNNLNTLVDTKLREQMLDWKISEVLHVEKPSQHFLDIAKKGKKEGNISEIKDDTGTEFESEVDRAAYIRDFYANLFSYTDTTGSIEDFLGHEICNSNMVKNSKLTESEKNRLDRDLTVEELDESLKKCNLKSAPGRDGFSNLFIKEFWDIFRIPLFTVAKYGLENNNLPDFFKTADIN